MTRIGKITFVGPAHYQRKKNAKGRHGVEFSILQQGGALKLEYDSMDAANTARRAIPGDYHSHSVPSNKLLSAIQSALEQAQTIPAIPDHEEPRDEVASEGQ